MIMKIFSYSIGLIVLSLALSRCMNNDVLSSEEQFKQQLANEVASIDSYLNSKKIVALKDASGIRFTLDSMGSGYTPRISDNVTFNFKGQLLDGSVFQTALATANPIKNLVTGLQIGMPLVPNGSKATFYIPSVYGYGAEAQTGIPSNSNLIYEIKLRNITSIAAEKTQKVKDTVLIRSYLDKAKITNSVKDTSGLRYVITHLGGGPRPSWLHKVEITYSGYIITPDGTKGERFFIGTNRPTETNDSRVVSYIRGFQVGLQKMREGGKAILYVPSVMGFGGATQTNGAITVPANSSLIYEVDLTDVIDP
jgi:FKBP-type peptidyl-prolyl cis-trans isomerase FkpA